jgi:DNA polymerase-4
MILHLDLDCFFVSASRIGKPHYHNRPVAVGGRSNLSIFDNKTQQRHLSHIRGAFTSSILSSNNDKSFKEYFIDSDGKVRGIITTASYEARAYGVKTAMSVSGALQLCPHLMVLPPEYPLYHKLSHELGQFLESQIPSVEQFSIDEFFGDITGWIEDKDAYDFAWYLKEEIDKKFELPISIGVAKTKWIAKLATNSAKPNGVKIIYPHEVNDYIENIKIEEFPGIGKGYQKRLQKFDIKTLGEVRENKELFYQWKKPGIQLYNRICGLDNEKLSFERSKKSIGIGRTFDPISDRNEMKRRIAILCRHLSFLAQKKEYKPTSYFLKIKYQYKIKSKDYINTNRLFNETYFKKTILELFDKIDIHPGHAIVQVNITIYNFTKDKLTTPNLLTFDEDSTQASLSKSMQKLRDKFGIDIIKTGSEF